jgi:hypothetical protein
MLGLQLVKMRGFNEGLLTDQFPTLFDHFWTENDLFGTETDRKTPRLGGFLKLNCQRAVKAFNSYCYINRGGERQEDC